jgi:hypothetical protein
LAIPPIIFSLIFYGLIIELPIDLGDVPELQYLNIITSILTLFAFTLLTYVYSNERKAQSIKITRTQWLVGGLLGLVAMGFNLFMLISAIAGHIFIEYAATILLGGISTLLIIYIVISLFSYYRVKKHSNTLVVMTGFVCLLLSKMVIAFHAILLITNAPSAGPQYRGEFSAWSGLAALIEVGGFIVFLVALLRLKVFR